MELASFFHAEGEGMEEDDAQRAVKKVTELWEDIKAAAIDARDNPKPQENALVNAAEGEHLDLPTLISVGFTPFPWALLIALSPVLSRCGWGGGGGCQH
jgi:hypothetical protein